MGRYAEAESRQLEAVKSRRAALGEDHPEFAESVNNLAALYRAMGRLGESESLYKKAIEIRRAALGDLQPDLATSLNNLALLYDSLGRYAEAEPLYRQAVEIWRKTLGNQHLHYAAGLNNLAMLYDSTGRYANAEPRSGRLFGHARGVLCRRFMSRFPVGYDTRVISRFPKSDRKTALNFRSVSHLRQRDRVGHAVSFVQRTEPSRV